MTMGRRPLRGVPDKGRACNVRLAVKPPHWGVQRVAPSSVDSKWSWAELESSGHSESQTVSSLSSYSFAI